jgi:very-short-patch-repair endonuclease
MSDIVIIHCKIHGDYQQTPSNHITHKQGCQKCANNYLSNATEFIEKAKKIHGDRYDYSKVNYENNHTEVIITCKRHGDYKQRPSSHLSGCGCTLCGIETMKTKQKTDINEFIEKAKKIHGNIYHYSKAEYINAKEEVIISCNHHGDYKQTPDSHLRGSGCPICVNKTEGKLFKMLQEAYPSIIRQVKREWCKNIHTNRFLPFDFCIEEYKTIIELDGRQHFEQVSNWLSPEEQFENDRYKEKCGNDNGYSIIRLLQEDVYNDKYDWKTELIYNIEKIKTDNIIQNIYMCKKNEYENFII